MTTATWVLILTLSASSGQSVSTITGFNDYVACSEAGVRWQRHMLAKRENGKRSNLLYMADAVCVDTAFRDGWVTIGMSWTTLHTQGTLTFNKPTANRICLDQKTMNWYPAEKCTEEVK